MKKDYASSDLKVYMIIKSPNDPSREALWALKLGLGGVLGLDEEVIKQHDGNLDIFLGSLGRRNDGLRVGSSDRECLVKKFGMGFGP